MPWLFGGAPSMVPCCRGTLNRHVGNAFRRKYSVLQKRAMLDKLSNRAFVR